MYAFSIPGRYNAQKLFFVLVIIAIPAFTVFCNNAIECKLSVAQDKIRTGAPILMRITVKNIGADQLEVIQPFGNIYGSIKFYIRTYGIDDQYQEMRTPYTCGGPTTFCQLRILPGESYSVYEILWFSSAEMPVFGSPGIYDVKVQAALSVVTPKGAPNHFVKISTDSPPILINVENSSELLKMVHSQAHILAKFGKADHYYDVKLRDFNDLPETIRNAPELNPCLTYINASLSNGLYSALPQPNTDFLLSNIRSSNDNLWAEFATLKLAVYHSEYRRYSDATKLLDSLSGEARYSNLAIKARSWPGNYREANMRIGKAIEVLNDHHNGTRQLTSQDIHSFVLTLGSYRAIESIPTLIKMISQRHPSPLPQKFKSAWDSLPFACALIMIGGEESVSAVLDSISDKRSEAEIKVLTWVLYRLLGETEASQKLVVAKVNSSTNQAAALDKALEILPMKDGLIEEP